MARRVRDAAELERQKLARQRFRSLIRSVVYNRIWLNDAEDQQKISMNVKRNVAMLVRRKHKIGVLTMADKALMRTPHSLRSLEDRKHLLRLVTGMQCFSKLPPQVRARLTPVIKFLYLSSGRVIIKEGGYADTVYFILYGEVEASRKVFDQYKGCYTDKVEFIYGPGDCIGDIEMIEECARKHTYVATSVVEMLVVFGHDFEEVLKAEMTKQWYEKMAAMKALGYFDHFNQEQKLNLNKLSVLQEFDALETIYYEDKGEASYVYFVLSGDCMILQSLQLKVREKRGIKSYELVDISQVKKQDEFERKNALQAIKKSTKVERKSYDIDQLLESDDEEETELLKIKQALKALDIKTIEIQCGTRQRTSKTLLGEEEETEIEQSSEKKSGESKVYETDFLQLEVESEKDYETLDYEGIEEHSSKTGLLFTRSVENVLKQVANEPPPTEPKPEEQPVEVKKEKVEEVQQRSTIVEEFQSMLRESQKSVSLAKAGGEEGVKSRQGSTATIKSSADRITRSSRNSKSARLSFQEIKNKQNFQMETRFIDVGSLTFGGIFGLGEKIEDRVIMARTKVQCLLIPRFWLFEKEQNPGRIWQRRRFVVQTGIPSREQLYHDFLNTRKWKKFKNDFILGILDGDSLQNETHLQDIPMMFHIINPIEEE